MGREQPRITSLRNDQRRKSQQREQKVVNIGRKQAVNWQESVAFFRNIEKNKKGKKFFSGFKKSLVFKVVWVSKISSELGKNLMQNIIMVCDT